MKKILMAAVAVSALSAGAASAASITAAKVSGITVTLGASPVAYRIASETKFGTGLLTTTTAADNIATVTVGAGQLGVGTYSVTYTLSGPASYQTLLLNSSLTSNAGANCIVAPVLASGGAIGGTTVTYSVSLSGTCSTSAAAAAADKGPSTFTLDQPLKVTGLGSVTLTAGLAQGGVSIDNGTSTAATLISNTAGFTATAAADTGTTFWALGTGVPYRTLGGADAIIGTYTVDSVAGIYVNADATTLASAENLTAALSLAGDFTNLTATASVGGAMTSVSPFTAATLAAQAKGTQYITMSVTAANTVSQSSKAFSLTVTPATTSSKFTVPAAYTTSMQTITLDGTSYMAPWVGGSQSTANTTIRLSNSGVATGAVTIALANAINNTGSIAGSTCTSSTLSKLASITTGTELVISQADLTTCFGAFKRGDVTVTVQSSSTSLTAKARNVNAASGDVAEISLGAS